MEYITNNKGENEMLDVLKYVPLNTAIFLLFNLLNIIIINKIIIKLFDLKNVREILLFFMQAITTIVCRFIIPILNNFSVIFDIILLKKFMKLKEEKLWIALIIKYTFTIILEMISIKTYIPIISIIEIIILIIMENKKIKVDIKECMDEKLKRQIKYVSLLSIIILNLSGAKIIKDIEKIPTYLYVLFAIMIISYFTVLLKNILTMLKEKDKNVIIENLEKSNKRLQENYDNVRAFKHDFNNIMQGIGGYIVANDMSGLEKMYKSITKECQEINEKQAINSNIINNPAILNLINNKIKLAEEKGIRIKIEVYVDLNKLKVSTYDLCRVLGILIDNAIEASIGCEEKVISIKFLRDKFNNRNLIIIENPCKNYLVDIKKIYEKGFSSKKDKISHGLGLWKVKQILKKNKNIQIYTSRDKLFKQQLEIY